MRMETVVDESTRDKVKALLGGNNLTGDLRFDEPMRNHTTLRIGGAAEVYAAPKNPDSLKNILDAIGNEDVSLTVIGGGSNVLISDKGIEGIVISTIFLNNVRVIEERADLIRLFAEAGVPLQRLINLSRDKGYRGMEGLAGIPGFLGGAVTGNAGSFGFEIGDVIESVNMIGRDGRISVIGKEHLDFGYRSSAIHEGATIQGVTMRLEKDDIHMVAERIKAFLETKRKEQPISERSAGCVFKNPKGAYAGKLMDETGCKGMRRGDIEVSGLHANFFINKGEGTASDFLMLMDDVKGRVIKAFGIELEPEIRIIGRK